MKKFGFTLAEVLIVLVIMGVISALTVPNLMGTADEKARITAFKKGYAEINNALQLASAENGVSPRGYAATEVDKLIREMFVPTMKLVKTYQNGFQTADGITYLIIPNAGHQRANCGSIPYLQADLKYENACFFVVIDSNGLQKDPNALTETAQKGFISDRFVLMMFENGIVPGESVAGDVIANNIWNTKSSADYALSSYNTTVDSVQGLSASVADMSTGLGSAMQKEN